MKLAKFLAHAGVASRRSAEKYIKEGKVSVDGERIVNVAATIDENTAIVKVSGETVKIKDFVYYKLNKPVGYVSSVRDPHNLNLVVNLVPKKPRVYPVGRLDKDSSGLMLLTNNGELALRLMHPRYGVAKVYEVTLDRKSTKELITKLKKGVKLSEGQAKADNIKILSPIKLHITLHQGWKRQIRRMLKKLDYEVIALKRISEGALTLGNLAPGKYKKISIDEIEK